MCLRLTKTLLKHFESMALKLIMTLEKVLRNNIILKFILLVKEKLGTSSKKDFCKW